MNNKLGFLFLTILLLISACESDKSTSVVSDQEQHFKYLIDDLQPTFSNQFGNFTFINTSGETYIVSTDRAFSQPDAKYFKITDLHVQVDMRSLSNSEGVVHFFAIKESDLNNNINNDISEFVKGSLAYTTQSGGSWNPYTDNELAQLDQGMVLVNNNTDFVLYVTEGGDFNRIIGYIDRKQLNAQMYISANGLLDLYFYDVDSGTLIDMEQVGVSKNSITRVTVGEPVAIEETVYLRLINNTGLHFNLSNIITDEPLYNENCNLCSTLLSASEGIIRIPAQLTTSLRLISTDASTEVVFDILPDTTSTRSYVIEFNDVTLVARLLNTTTYSIKAIDIVEQAKSTCENSINSYGFNESCLDYMDYVGTSYSPDIEDTLSIVREECSYQLDNFYSSSNQCVEFFNYRTAGIYQNKEDTHEVFQYRDSCNLYLSWGMFSIDCLKVFTF
ncbi:MAG: hypothetical protein DIZ80_08075 [endosymbiont of Galathealinum brachiosum]|uniref:Uncharacterized protein n=1 Tax=endosymbiont of Galathealinum brachiosum TaxID=2200906 RepID=A0A370DGS3_9GAMM|nr:MAG: hypothetical protein DIZ80_08075 [endosymbiont of Galathealinum brachiosum]